MDVAVTGQDMLGQRGAGSGHAKNENRHVAVSTSLVGPRDHLGREGSADCGEIGLRGFFRIALPLPGQCIAGQGMVEGLGKFADVFIGFSKTKMQICAPLAVVAKTFEQCFHFCHISVEMVEGYGACEQGIWARRIWIARQHGAKN